MDSSDPRYPVVQQLIAYWLDRPRAADTLDGICRWWLTGEPVAAECVAQALSWLVERGVVAAHEAADGRVRYRLADESPYGPC
jgi:hypothetical protein